MSSHEGLVTELDQAVAEQRWSRCSEICFRALYGMSKDHQRALATIMIRRYLPIFHTRWQTVTWPEQILDQPEQWVAQFDRAIPEQPQTVNPADASFIFCFDALLNGIAYRFDSAILTSSYVAAINAAINARATNVWIADDPEAIVLWEAQGYLPGRGILDNSAAIAVTAREWQVVADWLAEAQRSQLLNPVNSDEVERALERWKDHEMTLISPENHAG